MRPSETNEGNSQSKNVQIRPNRNILIEYNYVVGKQSKDIPGIPAKSLKISKYFDNSWREGRRVIELGHSGCSVRQFKNMPGMWIRVCATYRV